ncbi:hemagglutinin/amebocyte aggregation factor-like [Mixophyes fleayi]|uniref:hemagglutinin/amebocyte aggregation factor-like n=1 Tax=Mixophyes fleayi TaxID=3061075 RepID=UPI003F4DCFD5
MQVIVLLLMSIAPASAALWTSKFHQPFNYTCQNVQSIHLIISTFDQKFKDRVWTFGCQTTFSRPMTCYWTNYLSDLNKPFTFICPFGSVVNGITSYYDPNARDRRWQIHCCKGEVVVTRNCEWTGYVHAFEKSLRWEPPTNYYLTGAHSYYGNGVSDRRWSFYICQKK